MSIKVWTSPCDGKSHGRGRKQQPQDMYEEDFLPEMLTDKNLVASWWIPHFLRLSASIYPEKCPLDHRAKRKACKNFKVFIFKAWLTLIRWLQKRHSPCSQLFCKRLRNWPLGQRRCTICHLCLWHSPECHALGENKTNNKIKNKTKHFCNYKYHNDPHQ